MPNYNNGKTNQCNTSNCKHCRNKYSCVDYVSYLEKIANSPITPLTDGIISQQAASVNVDIQPILETLQQVLKHSTMVDQKLNLILTQIAEINNPTLESDALSQLNEKFDSITNMFRQTTAQVMSVDDTSSPENSLVMYNGANPLQKGDVYFEEKKTLFGGTKMVEKVVK